MAEQREMCLLRMKVVSEKKGKRSGLRGKRKKLASNKKNIGSVDIYGYATEKSISY